MMISRSAVFLHNARWESAILCRFASYYHLAAGGHARCCGEQIAPFHLVCRNPCASRGQACAQWSNRTWADSGRTSVLALTLLTLPGSTCASASSADAITLPPPGCWVTCNLVVRARPYHRSRVGSAAVYLFFRAVAGGYQRATRRDGLDRAIQSCSQPPVPGSYGHLCRPSFLQLASGHRNGRAGLSCRGGGLHGGMRLPSALPSLLLAGSYNSRGRW